MQMSPNLDKIKDVNYELCQAAMFGDLQTFKSCLKNGANINYQVPKAGYTVLHCAAANGYYNIIEYMLNYRNIKLNSVNSIGKTPLHFAARVGSVACLKLLIEAGADYDIIDKQGKNILHETARLVHIPATKYLLTTEIQKDIEDINGQTPADLAKQTKNWKIIKLFFDDF